MNILIDTQITAAMFATGTTIPAVDAAAGEIAWAAGPDNALGDRRVQGEYVYACTSAAGSGSTQPGTTGAAAMWLKERPTNRMAPFDEYLYTKARSVSSITYVLAPGFITGMDLDAIDADTLQISVTAGPGGVDLIPPISIDLWEEAFGEYEYLFGDLQRGTKYSIKDIPLHPAAHITITLSRNDPTVEAAIGYISVGKWYRLLSPIPKVNSTQNGAEVSTKDYSYYQENPDGTFRTVPGLKSTNISLTCVIAADQASFVKTLLERILGRTVAIEASDLPRYGYLSTVGKVTGSVKASDLETAQVNLQIKGNV